jgi:DNA-binding ferritin-like protein
MYNKLLAMLHAIRLSSADIHYQVRGDSFWGNHLFADELRDDIDDFIDGVNEICFLGSEREAPYSRDIMTEALEYIPVKVAEEKQMFINLKELVYRTLAEIERLMPEASAGEANLIGGIAENLQKKFGLLWRRIR